MQDHSQHKGSEEHQLNVGGGECSVKVERGVPVPSGPLHKWFGLGCVIAPSPEFFLFFTRNTIYAIARICYCPSVCPSVCLSVTRVDHTTRSQAVARIADRTAKHCRGHVT